MPVNYFISCGYFSILSIGFIQFNQQLKFSFSRERFGAAANTLESSDKMEILFDLFSAEYALEFSLLKIRAIAYAAASKVAAAG
jgi:hypothetical protein